MGQIVVNLEKGQLAEKQIKMYIEINIEKDRQIELLEKQVKNEEEKFLEVERKNVIDKKIADERDMARLREIEEANKPRWNSIFGSFGAGVVSGLLLVLLL